MGTPGFGFKSYLQFIKESSTYGVYTAPDKKVELVSWGVQPVLSNIPDAALNAKRSRRATYKGGRLYRGTFVCRMNYDGMTELLRGVWGGYAGSTVEAGVYQHVFKEGTTLNAYTMEIIIGDVPSGKCYRLLGVKFTGVTFKWTAGTGREAMGTAEFNVIGTDMVSDQSPVSVASFPTIKPVLFHQATTVDDGTADTPRVRSVEVSMENALADDRWYMGSVGIDEPLPNDFLTVKWKFTQEYQSKTLFDAAKALTVTTPSLLFSTGTDLAGATKPWEFELRSGTAYITDYGTPINGPDIIIATVTHEADYDTNDATALYARLQNKDAALT